MARIEDSSLTALQFARNDTTEGDTLLREPPRLCHSSLTILW